ncbi:acyl-CoA reductase [Pigmentiphaga litoralis]|uniref:Acyl-CoA reductase n=1 Tax=Pigmentiphaga litoralis TaxID=516702 RepID=A0A7Y9IXB0_9BURK|nr:acyl-CoA reductase [Pigmentiphaga litoralis]NYE21701.1 hypothetical protein [Pigmentiphaga litoralis]NYE84684.1 hypothetical protein [Pigmentiphaga litoralis]
MAWETLSFDAHGERVNLSVPRLTPEQLTAVADRVALSSQHVMTTLPVMDVVDAIDRAVARLLDVNNADRQLLEHLLPVITGFDREMVRSGLNAALKSFRRPQLLRFLVEDFGDPGLLDDFRPRVKGGWTKACGPRLLGHVWAGNVPALPLWSMVAGLLVKGGNVGKVSSDEPLFAGVFARVLAEVEPRLADALAVLWWPGSDAAMAQALCSKVDVLMVYGGDSALAAWQQHVPPGVRFLPHGHKISAGLVAASALDARQSQATARLAALDMVRWDQQGCYSPQVFYVERGAQVAPRAFAHLVAGELAAQQYRYGRRGLSLEETAGMAAWRQRLDFQAMQDDRVSLIGPADAPWSLAFLDLPQPPPPSALNRSACVVAVDRLDDVAALLAHHRAHLQTVGVAASPERLFRLAPQLAAAGATRICGLGAMATPDVGWHHDGRFSLLDLVRMVDIEASAETLAEAHASYRD